MSRPVWQELAGEQPTGWGNPGSPDSVPIGAAPAARGDGEISCAFALRQPSYPPTRDLTRYVHFFEKALGAGVCGPCSFELYPLQSWQTLEVLQTGVRYLSVSKV